MSVDERDRLALYEEAKGVFSEHAAGTLVTMLAEIPKAEDLATKADLESTVNDAVSALRVEMADRFRAQTLTLTVTMATCLVGGMAVAAGIARIG